MSEPDESNEVVSWLQNCAPEELASKRVMLCTKSMFLMDNGRKPDPNEYKQILRISGNVSITEKKEKRR